MSERLTQLRSFLEESPEDPFLHYAIATELLKLGKTEEALSGFEELITRHPTYVGTYYHLGKAYEGQGRLDEAIEIYEKGMSIARQAQERHALSELQTAWQQAKGLDDDEDEDEDDY